MTPLFGRCLIDNIPPSVEIYLKLFRFLGDELTNFFEPEHAFYSRMEDYTIL